MLHFNALCYTSMHFPFALKSSLEDTPFLLESLLQNALHRTATARVGICNEVVFLCSLKTLRSEAELWHKPPLKFTPKAN